MTYRDLITFIRVSKVHPDALIKMECLDADEDGNVVSRLADVEEAVFINGEIILK